MTTWDLLALRARQQLIHVLEKIGAEDPDKLYFQLNSRNVHVSINDDRNYFKSTFLFVWTEK